MSINVLIANTQAGMAAAYDWRGGVQGAESFEDIEYVFSQVFPFLSFDFRAHRRAIERRKDLDGLMSIVKSPFVSTKDKKYAAIAVKGMADGIAKGLKINGISSAEEVLSLLAEAVGDNADLLAEIKEPEPAHVVHDRLMADGESFVGTIQVKRTPEEEEKYQQLCSAIDAMQVKYDAEVAEVVKKWSEEYTRVSQECGHAAVKEEINRLTEEWEKIHDEANQTTPNYDADYGAYVKWQEELLKKEKEINDKSETLWIQERALRTEYLDPVSEKRRAAYAAYGSWVATISGMKNAKKLLMEAPGKRAIKAILDASPATKDAADKWAKEQVTVTDSAIKRLSGQGTYEDKGQLKEDIIEFYRLTGGRLGPVIIQTKGLRRANAAHWSATINIDGRFKKETLFHELGHLLEKDDSVRLAGCEFRDRRADKTKGLQKLRTLTKNSGYRSDEVAYTDDFWHPYIGKYYREGIGSEVVSMGMQMFSDAENAASLMEKDPKMFSLMVGIMRSSQAESEKKQTEELKERVSSKLSKKASLEQFYSQLAKLSKDEGRLLNHSSGLIAGFESYGRGARGRGKCMLAFYLPGDPQGPKEERTALFFKTWQEARNFAYLYLIYVQQGMSVDRGNYYAIANAVMRKEEPPLFADYNYLLKEKLKG